VEWVVDATRVDPILLEPGFATLLAAAGLSSITLGVESFSDNVLKHMGKASNRALALEAISVLRKAGVRVNIYVIYGYPVENEEDFAESLSGIEEIGDGLNHVVCNVFSITPEYVVWSRKTNTGIVTSNPRYQPAWASANSNLEVRQSRFFRMARLLRSIKRDRPASFAYLIGDAHNINYIENWNPATEAGVIRTWQDAQSEARPQSS